MRRAESTPTLAVERTENSKLSDPNGAGMSCTYAQQSTCPPACPLLGAGCYTEKGPLAFTTHRLNRAPVDTPAHLARMEADQIAQLSGWRRLRVHVVGDCRTPAAARIIGDAMKMHTARHNRAAWTYTHGWRQGVTREDWRGAAVLASCETPTQARQAADRGYPVALIVPKHPSRQTYTYHGLQVLPCPAQFKTNGTRGTTCERCRICEDPDQLTARGLVLGFEPDPQTRAAVADHLPR